MNLNPVLNFRVFGELAHNAQVELASRFIKWAFKGPEVTRGAPPLQQGQWLPIQASRDAAGNERPLGEGGQGVVHLWCCLDANNRIIDRVIVKNIYPGTEAWSMPSMWRKKKVGGEPREVWMCNMVYDALEAENPGDGRFVTRCLGYGDLQDPDFVWTGLGTSFAYESHPMAGAPHPALRGQPVTHRIPSYKLYFEYCPHGDLHDQIKAQSDEKEVPAPRVRSPGGHMRVQKVRRADGRLIAKKIRSGMVPFHEGFVWRMFEALAKCAVAMERANVLHGDLCPTNILMGEPDPNRFAIWPTPKLSDFGSSRVIDKKVENRYAPPETMQMNFVPPELGWLRRATDWEVDGLKVSHRTNVWQIGMVITCMMRLDFYLPECDWRTGPSTLHPNDELHFDDPSQRELHPHNFQHVNCNYSPNLLALVRQCMRFDPAHRPSPRELLQRIQARIPGSCAGMDTYTGDRNGRIPWNKKERLRDLKKDNEWPLDDDAEVVNVF